MEQENQEPPMSENLQEFLKKWGDTIKQLTSDELQELREAINNSLKKLG